MRIFRIVWDLRCVWVFQTPQGLCERPITPEEMTAFDVERQLRLNLWWRWGLLALPLAAMLLSGVGALASLV